MTDKTEIRCRQEWLAKLLTRFWSKVDRRGPDECWLWQGTIGSCSPNTPLRYGEFGVCANGGQLSYRAHRLSWMLANGQIPNDKIIMHKCDVPLCVNPFHLQLGTPLENARDRDSKQRCPEGEDHYDSRLTNAEVLEIFDDKQSSNSALARRFGVHHTNIMKIRQGRYWKRLLRKTGRIAPASENQ